MSDAVCKAIASASSGFVEAPAGCGKTETIVQTVGRFCDGRQLVLTHTNAGVDALRQRLRVHSISQSKYHVDTIAGWSWGWVRMYPANSVYSDSTKIADWSNVYSAMCTLLQREFVRQGVINSYNGIIVDEYQDCTIDMHRLIVALKDLLPCRVLGDDLQGIFGFRDEKLVDWSDVRSDFGNDLGSLVTPHRWIKAGNKRLGEWLLTSRAYFRASREPSYRGSPIEHLSMNHRDLSKNLIGMVRSKEGRICVIGHKARPLPAGIETSLVNQKFRILEPNDLSVLQSLVVAICDEKPAAKPRKAMAFFKRVFGGLGPDDQRFLQNILSKKRARATRKDRKVLYGKHQEGVTPGLLLDLLDYVANAKDVSCKLRESASALRCILEGHLETDASIEALYADEVSRRKCHSRSKVYRCVGSTLLVKGLEFDHAIILRNADWNGDWGTHKDVYVALSRGAKSTTLVDLTK
jgi:AAA domain